MTRKDYIAIAAAIKATRERAGGFVTGDKVAPYQRGAAAVALELAHIMAMDNPHFDCSRFLAACGMAE